ncbi:hypothetical protein TNCV_856281 [Trichonephila clavipes]|nr:hypothetical protein TNCV_856281 [Trichonephila clavipes]
MPLPSIDAPRAWMMAISGTVRTISLVARRRNCALLSVLATCRDSSWICLARRVHGFGSRHCMKMTGMVEEQLWRTEDGQGRTKQHQKPIGDDSQFIKGSEDADKAVWICEVAIL